MLECAHCGVCHEWSDFEEWQRMQDDKNWVRQILSKISNFWRSCNVSSSEFEPEMCNTMVSHNQNNGVPAGKRARVKEDSQNWKSYPPLCLHPGAFLRQGADLISSQEVDCIQNYPNWGYWWRWKVATLINWPILEDFWPSPSVCPFPDWWTLDFPHTMAALIKQAGAWAVNKFLSELLTGTPIKALKIHERSQLSGVDLLNF